jgi:phosphatidylserine decarboxylase
MTIQSAIVSIVQHEDLNFLLTNRIPRRLVTQFMGWFAKREEPLVRDLSLAVWKFFADLELDDAKSTDFKSMHDCFIRELKPGARPIAGACDVLVAPCDAILGGSGRVDGDRLIQAKSFSYTLLDLLRDPALVRLYRNGTYATLRLTSSMYHRFHAPHDCTIDHVTYVSGDTFNTNPIALARVEKLFCKNERAIVQTTLKEGGHRVTLVPVAAILIASIRLHFLDVMLHLRHPGPHVFPCAEEVQKGQELGWFQHGSTIIVFAPEGFTLCPGLTPGARLRMGEPLMQLPRE